MNHKQMSLITSLACMIGIGCSHAVVHWSTFGQTILDSTTEDGDMVIFNGMGDPGHTFEDIPTFVVGDKKLERFIGVAPEEAVVLEVYKNRSDFHVYDFAVDSDTPWVNKIPKEFVQPTGTNQKLGLEYAETITSNSVQFTLVFDDEDNAVKLATKLKKISEFFPTFDFKCWDIIESDIGKHTFDYPGIVVSSKAHGDDFYSLQPPLTERAIGLFVEANIMKNKEFEKKNSKTKKKNKSEKKTVYRSDL